MYDEENKITVFINKLIGVNLYEMNGDINN